MAIPSIDAALSNKSDAIKYLNSPDATSEGKAKIVAKYGAAQVDKWTSVDSTKYEISDDEKADAKSRGRDNAESATDGFDGEADNTKSTISSSVNVVGGVAGAAAGVLSTMSSSLNNILCFCNNIKIAFGAIVAAIGALLLSNAIYLKSANPNEEPAQACEDMAQVMQDEAAALDETQQTMEEAEAESTALADEANETNNDGNKNIDTKKTEFDFYRNRYNALKAKADNGEKLTPEEKALMTKLAPLMNNIGTEIEGIETSTSDKVSALSDKIGECQTVFDDSAETMETIQGETEYLAGFDEDTESNAKAVAATSDIGVAGALGVMGGGYKVISQAWSKGLFAAPTEIILGGVAIAEGVASGLIFKSVISDQNEYANKASNAINERGITEEANTATSDMYDEKLDTYAALTEGVDELEIVVPEDLEVPAPSVSTEGNESGGAGLGGNPNNKGGTNGNDGANGANPFNSAQKSGAEQNSGKPDSQKNDKDNDKKFFV